MPSADSTELEAFGSTLAKAIETLGTALACVEIAMEALGTSLALAEIAMEDLVAGASVVAAAEGCTAVASTLAVATWAVVQGPLSVQSPATPPVPEE